MCFGSESDILMYTTHIFFVTSDGRRIPIFLFFNLSQELREDTISHMGMESAACPFTFFNVFFKFIKSRSRKDHTKKAPDNDAIVFT